MSKPLRILRVTPHFFRPDIWPAAYDPVGGLQTQVWRLTAELDRAGVSQTVLTSHIPGSARQTRPFPSTRVLGVGAALPRFLADPGLNPSWFAAAAPHLVRHAREHDVVHIHYNHSVWCRALALIAGRLGVPLVVTLNTALWGGLAQALGRFGERLDITRRIERSALTRADRILALTAGNAAHKAASLGLGEERFAVVPDAIRAADFSGPVDEPAVRRFRRAYRIPDGKPVVAYIGRISPEKGWDDIPPVAAELSAAGAFMLVCGDGPDREKLEARMRGAGCADAWSITGFLLPEDVRTALAIADVLILPSRREAFGSVLLEAMAAGVPAVAYEVGGIAEVAGTPNAIVLAPAGDRAALASAVLRLLDDDRLRADMIARGRQRVEHFSIEASAARTLDIYRELVEAPAAAGLDRPVPQRPELGAKLP